ncbi:MAG: uroporphyrinogen decarboxylase [Phycisphaeraceae bacterium]|nr:uroporphyrinogen decarboxylase [Phycisphaeraceae bacterium]
MPTRDVQHQPEANRTNAPANDLLLEALAGRATPRTPIWLMRQAGRFDPEYRALRQSCGLELEELFAHPELAARITALPLRFGVDAAILFQDILTILTPMGAPFVFRPGPVTEHPVRNDKDAQRLKTFDVRAELSFIARSIELALDRIHGRVPLLGFAGAPLTLLAFLVEGQSPMNSPDRLRWFLGTYPEAAHRLLDRLAGMTADYLSMQIEAGVHAVQLFESCADLLDEQSYRTFAMPYQRKALAQPGRSVPCILFARDTRPDLLAEAGTQAISIGSGFDVGEAREVPGPKCVQGNICNRLLLEGPVSAIREAALECLRSGGSRGHVLNLGHGVLKDTPVEHVQALIDCAHEFRPQRVERDE